MAGRISKRPNGFGLGTRVTKKSGFGTRVTKKSGFGTRVTRKQSDPREDITSNIDDLGKASNEEASLLAPNIATTDETKDYSEDLLAMWHRCRDGGILPGIYGCENMMDPEEGSEIITEENNSDQLPNEAPSQQFVPDFDELLPLRTSRYSPWWIALRML